MLRVPCALASIALASSLLAQNSCPDGGLGSPIASFELDARTGNQGHLGLERVGSAFYVSARGVGALPPHQVYVIDDHGTLLRSFPQPAAANGSFWGIRDLTTDGSVLIGGDEFTLHAFDTNGASVSQVAAANGARPLGNFQGSAAHAIVGTFRGLAFDPAGNAGNGSFFTASYGSPIVEMSLAGSVLRQLPNTVGWTVFGLALDRAANSLWVFGDSGGGDVLEIDLATGAATGRSVPLQAVAGGLTLWNDGLRTKLAALDQSGPDRVRVHSLRAVRTVGDGLVMETSIDGGPFRRDYQTMGFGAQTLAFRAIGTPANAPAACFLNVGGDALACGSLLGFGSSFQSLADFVVVSAATVPSGIALDFPIVAGATITLPLSLLPTLGAWRAQAIWIDPRVPSGFVPLIATNEVEVDLDLRTPLGVVAEAFGENSFNSTGTSGFFAVTNPSSIAITRLSLRSVGGMVFDVDQVGMAERFDAGNSGVPGCIGTFRNGSDVAAGLDYSLTGSAPCDPSARQGFTLGQNGTLLEFHFRGNRFANGVRFEFDCDTDGGAGVDGWAMAGMVVEIDLANGERRSATIAVDALTAWRAFATL